MKEGIKQLISAVLAQKERKQRPVTEDVLTVSDTISAAASVYETIRNTLEYDEEHLLRRNAIRRILKRRLEEVNHAEFAEDLLHELIWARYLPNKRVPESMIKTIAGVVEKYDALFVVAGRRTKEGAKHHRWLLDVLSTEIDHAIEAPLVDESLAGAAYQHFLSRIHWSSVLVKEKDRELQVYIAAHRAVLKSNLATLRYRLLTLYYPTWATATASDAVVGEIALGLRKVIDSIEGQISHPAAEAMLRLVRKYAIVFHVLKDIALDDPRGLLEILDRNDVQKLDKVIVGAAGARYRKFGMRLRRSVFRAVLFLFLTKMLIGLIIELPYERLVINQTSWTPLLSNILFHPILLSIIGLTVVLPQKKNTARIISEVHGMLGDGELGTLSFKTRRTWSHGAAGAIFYTLYTLAFMVTIGFISWALRQFDFNAVSIFFFLFFLSLVTFFGLKIRNTKRDLLLVETSMGWFAILIDILFLPIIRAGRFVALRAPRINVFLFFFDFIIEAPFKAAIRLIEGWLAFLREKHEEI